MSKKILAACISLVAFAAFAVVPAIAAASPVLKTSGGATVATGTEITATNVGNILLTTASGTLTCTSADMGGKVVTNSGTVIEGTIETASFTGTGPESRCTSTISDLLGGTITAKVTPTVHMCLRSTTLGVWGVTGKPCPEHENAPVVFHLDIFTHFGGSQITTCTYERNPSVTGTNNTGTSPLTLTIDADQTFTKTAGSSLCPTTGTLEGVFVLKTKAGGELKVE